MNEVNSKRPTQVFWRCWLPALLLAGAVYVVTAAPGVLWGDSGDAQLRTLWGRIYERRDLSRSHPMFYLLAMLVDGLGFGAARAATLVSAFGGAVTVANVAALLRHLRVRPAAVFCGAVLIGLSHALWHQATIAEVMTLTTALMTLELILVTHFVRTGRFSWLLLACFVNGVNLSVHNMALLLWPAYVVLLVLTRRRAMQDLRSWHVLALAAAVVLGAMPLVLLFFGAWVHYGDAGRVIQEMLLGRFARSVFNVGLTRGMVTTVVGYTGYSFPTPLILLAAVGPWAIWRLRAKRTSTFITVAWAGVLVFALRYKVPDQHVFLLHSHVIACVFVGVGVEWVCRRYDTRWVPAVCCVLALPAPVVYATVPDLLRAHPEVPAPFPKRPVPYRDPFNWFLKPWRGGYDGPARFAREVLHAMPPDALLGADSTLWAPVLYLQAAEGVRRDVRLIVRPIYQPWLDDAEPIDARMCTLAAKQGRMYSLNTNPSYLHNLLKSARFRFVKRGIVYRVEVRPPARGATPGSREETVQP